MEQFLTEGTNDLYEFRVWCTKYSLARAKDRVALEKETKNAAIEKAKDELLRRHMKFRKFQHLYTQACSERPMSYVALSKDAKYISSGSFGGEFKLWTINDLKCVGVFQGHSNHRISCSEFHPDSRNYEVENTLGLVSSDSMGIINLYSLKDPNPMGSLAGHKLRVSRLSYHPSGLYIGSASYDTTWRLWDLEKRREILRQEGHSKEVYCIAFHPDGGIVATGGFDGNGMVWDIRSGRPIFIMKEHVQPILGIEISANGHEIATGSEDHTIKVWDLRKLENVQTILAHNSIVTSLKYNSTGSSIISTSYDGTSKIFCSHTYRQIKVLQDNENKTMNCDISRDDDTIVVSSYNRYFKIWGMGDDSNADK